MRPQTIGRVLGIGVRVAGRMAGQRLTASAQAAPAANASQGRTAGQAAGRASGGVTKGLARGIGGFLRPFRRIGGILWLEVTGVFFLIFVLTFARSLWHNRASYAHGPDHAKFVLAACLIAVFLYLTISSFWRARRR